MDETAIKIDAHNRALYELRLSRLAEGDDGATWAMACLCEAMTVMEQVVGLVAAHAIADEFLEARADTDADDRLGAGPH
jgi:hypothetical protein